MKLVTYNLHFGGKGHVHWGQIIDQFDPDLLFVQESHAPDLHLPPLLHGERHKRAFWDRVQGEKGLLNWGSGVYAKTYFPVPLSVLPEKGWITAAEIEHFAFLETSPQRLRIISLHAATRKPTNYVAEVNAALDGLLAFRDDCELVIAGDFNLTVSPRHPSEKRPLESAEQKIQARLHDEFGLVNCWERCNPGQPLAQTLRDFSQSHCDGIFVPVRWAARLRSCTVLAGEPWNKLSDHYPVVAEFV